MLKKSSTGMRVLLLGALLASAGPLLAADRVEQGRREYQWHCASCHGGSGKGDGPLRATLRRSPADLTLLARNNGGVFPEERVRLVIDGRADVQAHGTRDMPVWGNRYAQQAKDEWVEIPVDTEAYSSARIMLLAEYLNRIQAR